MNNHQSSDTFFVLEHPNSNVVHLTGVPLLFRGVIAIGNDPDISLRFVFNNETLFVCKPNDTREDVRLHYPPSRSHQLPCGFHYHINLPPNLDDGVYPIEIYANGEHHIGLYQLRISAEKGDVANPFADGHFYSSVVNIRELVAEKDRVWPKEPKIFGIDFCINAQCQFLTEDFPKYGNDFDYPYDPPHGATEWSFRLNNPVFCAFDAKLLFVMLRKYKPKNVIEIGSGYSSLLVADVNCRFFENQINFTCIEPYPRPMLKNNIPGLTRLIEQRVQNVSFDVFESLGAGDILFIDSSHVGKTGSDVNHEFFEIIPRLKPGVIVHVHDIFLPHDYPIQRVLAEKLSWNEQYLLRAMLMFSPKFEVIFGTSCARHYLPHETLKYADTRPEDLTGSFWFQVKE